LVHIRIEGDSVSDRASSNSRGITFMRFLIILMVCFNLAAFAGGHRRSSHSTHPSGHRSSHSYHYRPSYHPRTHSSSYSHRHSSVHHSRSSSVGGARDSHGRIRRSESAKRDFMKQTGYPHGRPGYVIDHVVPLSKGGADRPSNMQWQTKADAKAKDKWEKK
jgi:hypothetical protein